MNIPGYDEMILRGPDEGDCPLCSGDRVTDCPDCDGLGCPDCDGDGTIACECNDEPDDDDYPYERARDDRMDDEYLYKRARDGRKEDDHGL